MASARDLPWRRTLDPYAVWVSEIMLQQTQVKTVIPYYERWLQALPDIDALANARPEQVLKLWEGLGYYTRARNLQKAARQIVAEQGGRFPREFEAVLALPGIGRYTAGAICSIAYNQPTPILDGNVIRVLTRLCGVRSDPREKRTNEGLWELAEGLVVAACSRSRRHCANAAAGEVSGRGLQPGTDGADLRRLLQYKKGTMREGLCRDGSSLHSALVFSGSCSVLNQSLMELGATICLPREPRCGKCPLAKRCVAKRAGLIDRIPKAAARPPVSRRRFVALVAQRRGRLLVRQRGPREVNGSLWEFPNVEAGSPTEPASKVAARLSGTRVTPLPLCRVKHSITRHRIELEAFTVALDRRDGKRLPLGRWISFAKTEHLAFASAHRKVLAHFLRHHA